MAKVFHISELANFAIEKEQQSEELYQKLAALATDPEVKQLFETLVGEEKQHEAYYRELLESVHDEDSPEIKDQDEYTAYMQELIEASRKLAPLSESQIADMPTSVDYAIDRERDAILFYTNLKNFVPVRVHDKVDTIIREETKHAIRLMQLRKQL